MALEGLERNAPKGARCVLMEAGTGNSPGLPGDSNAFIEVLISKQCTPVIPPKRNRLYPRIYDADIYKERHLIECFFGKIKHFRRIFSRFDKTSQSFLSFLQFASIFIWLR